tara:strand:+ start:1069 stop:2076 length:1008 start_codon:yes stop_codon:yes gene_type:complete
MFILSLNNFMAYFLKNLFITFFIFFVFSKTSLSNETLSLEDNFFPEGIAVSKNGDLFVGSLKENKVVRLKKNGKKFEEFIPSKTDDLLSVIGMIVDDYNKILWVCSSYPGVTNYPVDNPVVSLKAFDLSTGNPIDSYPLPGGGFCNDVTIDKDHNVYITDSFNPRVLRLNKSKSRLETWFENDAFKGEGFNLNGITFINNNIYLVKMNSGELFKIGIADNGKPINFKKIILPRSLSAPDGIEAIDKNNLLVVENKDGNLAKINLSDPIKIEIIKDNLDTPTTAAIKGNTAWVLQAQFGHLFGDEKDIPPGPFEIAVVEFKPSFLTSIKKLLNFLK